VTAVELGDDAGPDGGGQRGSSNAKEGQHSVVSNLAQATAKTKIFPEFLYALRAVNINAKDGKNLLYGKVCRILGSLPGVMAKPSLGVACRHASHGFF
jgi:hypothetical protein